jgi:hypothetical protein
MEPSTIDIEMLRQLAITQPESASTRILALLLCAAFLAAVLILVHRGRLREEYTPIWTIVAVGMMVATLWFDSVRLLTRMVGAWTPSSTLFFFGLVFLLVVSLNYAVRLSGLSRQLKLLAQEVALLRQRVAEREGRATTAPQGTAET